ncbi:LINE-1 retrotransposable element O protein [Sesamum angolense]|uniref:LINE-1 retrotransposable element O protein n=1 Tax=Sesamum angolense TaxID=2727404 RepID=A0AAE1T6M8_9LAMI|nr:LINE-1 retrotransposable element O protein [Sesamum angolense]
MFKLQQKLFRLKSTLKTWNIEVFGNIFDSIKKAEHKAKVAEQAYDANPSDELLIAMNKATTELTLAFSIEETYWKQKTACKWLSEGKKNTKTSTPLSRRNVTSAIFHEIQHNGDANPTYSDLDWVPTLLFEEDTRHLSMKPTINEVKCAVFDMSPDSVASPDGFSAHFYQVSWDIIGEDLFEAVMDFFTGAQPLKTFTTTTIVLIPKIEIPITWKDFQPTSLCNVTGKILSKVVNNQITQLLPKIISPYQSGFVQERMIADNILLAQELTNCPGKGGSVNNIIMKLDMEKAYDRMNWNFLYCMLTKLGFPKQWIELIKKQWIKLSSHTVVDCN